MTYCCTCEISAVEAPHACVTAMQALDFLHCYTTQHESQIFPFPYDNYITVKPGI